MAVHSEGHKIDVPVLRPLRGDFFCLPFGGNATAHQGRRHPVHGEPAGAPWHLDGGDHADGVLTLTLSMKLKTCPGKVTKVLALRDGQNVVYSRHVMEGFGRCRMPAGHHACLAMPEQPGTVLLSTSPIQFGMTCPGQFSDPAAAEYQDLASAARFTSLAKVPRARTGAPAADCSVFPQPKGFDDLLAVFNKTAPTPAWCAAVNTADGYLWFSLKDPDVLPATALWMSHGGRHGEPWNGRNRCLGVEDCCAFFAEGLAESVKANVLTRAGIKTALSLSEKKPTAVNYIQGVVKIPGGFGRVADVALADGEAAFLDADGRTVTAPVNADFLKTGQA